MTGTTRSFAATPDRVAGSDILADALRAIRLHGSVFLNACFKTPFGVVTPRRFDPGSPLAHFRHVSIFHLIASGSCVVKVDGVEPTRISAGDILLVPFADEHRFWNGDDVEMVKADTLIRASNMPGLSQINYGGDGEALRMVCGFIESSEFLIAPVFRTLPPLLIDRTGDDKVSALLASTVQQIITLTEEAAPGTEIVLGRLMEILFIEVLRRYTLQLPPNAKGWFAAVNDPLLSRALQVVHGEPARRWTVDDIAREAGSSRTVVAERFNAVLGQSPMEYVTHWRMQIAAERLRSSRESLAEIAAGVGYESEAAFNRAFKRVTGETPGRWRDSASALI
jgi:AraC family transcriptional regulator, alkane utilization regulator